MDNLIRPQLEKEFTSMLMTTGTYDSYWNLAHNYFLTDKCYNLLPQEQRSEKLAKLRSGHPKEWITQVFTEGLDIPPQLYQVNIMWLKRLETVNWES